MRKSIFLTTFILTTIISCGTILGQKNKTRDAEYFPRHEFYVQYGVPSILELTSTLNPSTSQNENELSARDVVFSGVGGIGYNFSVTDQLSFGIDGGISLARAEIYSSTEEKETHQYSSHIISYTGQISGHWTYFEEGAVQISSGVYLGISYRDGTLESRTSNPMSVPKIKPLKFAYHITAIKVRYGNIIGGFAELGFGYRGLVNVGLSIKM